MDVKIKTALVSVSDKSGVVDFAKKLSEMRKGVVELCRGCDLVIYDTMFRMDEYLDRPHWGHSSPEHAIALLEEGQAEIMEVVLGAEAQIAGKPLKEAKLPKGSLVGAAMRGREVFVPSGDTVLEPGDTVIFFALTQSVEALEERLQG